MSSKFNPCFCWNLKDGCMIVGVWSLVWAIIELGIFSWQTVSVKYERDKFENRRIPGYQSYSVYENRLGGGDWSSFYITPEENIFRAIFIIQILSLISAFSLLFASVSLVLGIHTSSKFLIWPWFPCMLCLIICSIVYCVLWWLGNAQANIIALTVIQFLSVILNIYCMICIFVQYRRVADRYVDRKRDEKRKSGRGIPEIYEYKIESDRKEPYGKKKIFDEAYAVTAMGYDNGTYEHEIMPGKVSLFEKEPARHRGAEQYQQGQPYLAQQQQQELMTFPEEPQQLFGAQQQQGMTVDYQKEKMADEIMPQETTYKDTFREGFLKQVVAKSERTPLEDRLKLGKDEHQLEEEKRVYDAKQERRSRSSKSKEDARSGGERYDDNKALSCDICYDKQERRRGGKKELPPPPRRRHEHESRDRSSRPPRRPEKSATVGDRRSRSYDESRRGGASATSKTTCGHYERKKSRERSGERAEAAVKTQPQPAGKDAAQQKAKRSVRDVKRESQAKQQLQHDRQVQAPVTGPCPTSTTSGTAAAAGAGVISIPQNIVIPAQPGRTTPQRYQISSEVTISYQGSTDKSAESSRANSSQARQVVPEAPAPATAANTAPVPASSTKLAAGPPASSSKSGGSGKSGTSQNK